MCIIAFSDKMIVPFVQKDGFFKTSAKNITQWATRFFIVILQAEIAGGIAVADTFNDLLQCAVDIGVLAVFYPLAYNIA